VNDTAIGILVCVSLLFVATLAAVFVLMLRDRIFGASAWQPPATAERIAYEARIIKPDWPFYERHLGRPVPVALRELYRDRELILSGGFQYDEAHYISTFEPLDAAALLETSDFVGFDILPFANSDGDMIYLRPGPGEPGTVFITYHDGGDTGELAPDVSTFLQCSRGAKNAVQDGSDTG
jgi:hypothetical protein